jgi:hypothetical protein
MTDLKYPDKIRAQEHMAGMAYDRGNVYDGDKGSRLKNRTDYTFPWGWGMVDENGDPMWTQADKDRWFHQERAYRQAMRQDTTWGKTAQEFHSDSEYKVDDDTEFT